MFSLFHSLLILSYTCLVITYSHTFLRLCSKFHFLVLSASYLRKICLIQCSDHYHLKWCLIYDMIDHITVHYPVVFHVRLNHSWTPKKWQSFEARSASHLRKICFLQFSTHYNLKWCLIYDMMVQITVHYPIVFVVCLNHFWAPKKWQSFEARIRILYNCKKSHNQQ